MLMPPRIRDFPTHLHRDARRAVVRALALLLSITIPLTACGGSGSGPGPSASGGARKLKVALLVPGLTNDGAWSQVAREAVERLEKDGRVDADIREKLA